MNDAILDDLKAHVERTVTPLLCSRARKRRMREELLAHLLAVFDEELARRGEQRAAADAAKRRFGNASELKDELQASIPLVEGLIFRVSGRENTMWRWLFALGCVAILVGLGFICPALAQLRDQGRLIALEVPLLILGVVLTLGGLGSVGYGIKAYRMRNP